jgi:hypothetical protein
MVVVVDSEVVSGVVVTAVVVPSDGVVVTSKVSEVTSADVVVVPVSLELETLDLLWDL